jgi:hypothetical protein
MSNWKNLIFKDEPAAPLDAKTARKRAILLASPFALLGITALVMLVHDLFGGLPKQKIIKTLSFVAVCFGLVALIIGINAKKMHALKPGQNKTDDNGKPWLKRKDWASGRVTSGTRKGVFIFWFFTFFWNAVSAPILFIGVPNELHKGNYAILIALLFPVVGVAMIIFAARTTLAWKRFGQTIFEMAAVPAALGGTLEGEISVKTKLQPQHGLHLRLSCIRQTTTGGGKDRSTTERILWQDEKWLRADLPQTDLNATGIPVYFKLPADRPESTAGHGDGIRWKLEAAATLRGPDFHAEFEVPVFKLAETPEISEDPTLQYQMSLEEIRKQIGSKIRVNDLPDGGREFIFPAARNPGSAAGLTLIWLIWTGIVIALVWNWKRVPFIFPLLFGVFDLLITIFAFNLWFQRSRVVITPGRVTVQKSWLGLKTERIMEASSITGLESEVGMTAGHSAYYDLKIRTAGGFADRKAKFSQTGQQPRVNSGGDITAASGIADKPEAEWLARQMLAALKNIPATDTNA